MKITHEILREDDDWIYGVRFVDGERLSEWMQPQPHSKRRPPTSEELDEIERQRCVKAEAYWAARRAEKERADEAT